jgi:hypothetical protein
VIFRPSSHVKETKSKNLLRSLLPDEWIIRELPEDYGVDLEVELVDQEFVTGNRLWIQLKASDTFDVHEEGFEAGEFVSGVDIDEENSGLRIESGGVVVVPHLRFSMDTAHLKYSLKCGFPLLLCLADLDKQDIFWVPLPEAIRWDLEERTPSWRSQKSATLRVPLWNSMKREQSRDYYGLRWFSMEPARMYAFSTLAYLDGQMKQRIGFASSNHEHLTPHPIPDKDHAEFIQAIALAKKMMSNALEFDVLYGEYGILHVPNPLPGGICASDFPDLIRQAIGEIDRILALATTEPSNLTDALDDCQFLVYAVLHQLQNANNLYQEFRFTYVLTRSAAIMRALS